MEQKQCNATQCDTVRSGIGAKGIEQCALAGSKTPILGEGGAKSGARSAPNQASGGGTLPPDLAEIVAAWPELPAYLKTGFTASIRAYLEDRG